ncbi:MBL fold metallo-hydrolase [Deinococcus cellulosilyticus]|uniref:Zinc metallohydrolase n=1 Tax=Deinococcus cellulosilyticus (strain DSM 18568 / NBRC 106333 / KACC 11606 / 5516J-15) TaxID=1223518 RepID=A0A511MYP0_DEIC1|nr:MBL fold metallo-hydrolase [Deinococcus cellulosilyticus]GEM45715.1 zinc metallohydrolase [Deinococcus cellulosilyticus NBRC 106333 = KACC 11606]
MPDLITLEPGIHYFPGGVNIGIIEDVYGKCLIIDTGLDSDHARKLLKALQSWDLTPAAILNTHSHADHYGGNHLILQRHPEIEVFAPPLESAIIQHPILEPLYLFGARPIKELQGKFLMGKASPAVSIPQTGLTQIAGIPLELISVPGHACEMYAVRMGSVLFAADALFGEEVLQKHPLTYCVDSKAQKDSVRTLKGLEGIEITLPGHGNPSRDLQHLCEMNLQSFQSTTDAVLQSLEQPSTIDEVLQHTCTLLGIHMHNPASVLLNRSVVSAHLAELLEAGQVKQEVRENRWEFSRV